MWCNIIGGKQIKPETCDWVMLNIAYTVNKELDYEII